MDDRHYTRRCLLKGLAASAVALPIGIISKYALGVGDERKSDSLEVAPRRVLHLITKRLALQDAERLFKLGRTQGFNTVILGVAWRGSASLNSMPWVKKHKFAWTPSMLRELSDLARSLGYDVIPNLPLLSKAHKLFLGERPELLFNKSTYDPRNEDVYATVLPIIDEIVELMEPKSLHIGHDEVVGWKKKHYQKGLLKSNEKMLPAKLFAEDTLRIYEYLYKKDVRTWMWGDMLVSKEEFPSITAHGSLHSGIEKFGYGRDLRKAIPRDIVICDWQYRNKAKDFPTLKAFIDDGFTALGSTFEDLSVTQNFSRYAAKNRAAGMVATTWYYVMRKDWETVDRIIKESGRIFSKSFP